MSKRKPSGIQVEPEPEEPTALVAALWRVPGEGWRYVVRRVPVSVIVDREDWPPPDIRAMAQGRVVEAIEKFET